MEYSNEEYADMHLMYGRALCNASAARRFYQHSYPNRRIPDRKTFERIDQRLRETGQFAPVTANRGAPRTARTVEVEENILDEVAAHPTVSIRSLSSFTNVPKTTVARILREQLLHPYHIQKVHALNPDDFRARVQFSQWFLQRHEQNPMFTRLILYTDEASFGRNGVINSHNLHYWSDENPHAIIETRHQRQFYVNVWSGIIGPYLLGPFVLPPRLNGQRYLDFLVHQLPQLLEDVDLETRNALIFMHDGAPPHFSAAVRTI